MASRGCCDGAIGGVLLAPSEFLAEAEANWVIRAAHRPRPRYVARPGRRVGARGPPDPVAVNISPANLTDFSVVESVERLLIKHGVPPSRLTLEVTETAALEKPRPPAP